MNADRMAEAHGGRDHWRALGEVSVSFSAGGIAFAGKGQGRTLVDAEAVVSTTSQQVRLRGVHPQPWEWSVGDGAELATALAPLPRRLRWSVDDLAAFAGAALWTYLNLPFLAVDVEPLASVVPGLHRLAVQLPVEVTTHAPHHVLHVDDAGVIRRHDYTAVAFGQWARAAQAVMEHRTFDGVLVPTRRRVTPRLPGHRRAPWPTLVWVDVDDVRAGSET